MDFIIDLLDGVGMVLAIGLGLALLGGAAALMHFVLTFPMRRAERVRMFVNMVDVIIKDGRPLEETIISAARSRDLMLGIRFHLVVAWMEQGLRLDEAVAKVPRFLPPQVTAMLKVGRKIGDIHKVLPACRQYLKDSVSQTRGALNYLFLLTFVLSPAAALIVGMLKVVVLPKFMEIGEGLGMGIVPSGLRFVAAYSGAFIAVQLVFLAILWLAVAAYIAGPGFVDRLPGLQAMYYRVPWRRKRMQRDLSTMLAILLDSGMPEPEALALAADCTGNKVFKERASRCLESLKQGLGLTQAIERMDDSGEFGWRLRNAIHARSGFMRALAGWHESLDAKAFQEEQATAHVITTGLVLWSGLFVGTVVVSVFSFLVSITNAGVLW